MLLYNAYSRDEGFCNIWLQSYQLKTQDCILDRHKHAKITSDWRVIELGGVPLPPSITNKKIHITRSRIYQAVSINVILI